MFQLFRARRAALLAGIALLSAPASAQDVPSPVEASAVRAQADQLAAAIVARMTLEEKLPQLLNVAPAIPRLNIPAYNWWTESLHGAIGALGDATRVLRGDYSSTQSAPPVSVVEGLRRAAGAGRVTLVPFGETITDGDRVPAAALRAPDGKPGLLARYFNPVTLPTLPFAPGTDRDILKAMTYQDTPVVTRHEADIAARTTPRVRWDDITGAGTLYNAMIARSARPRWPASPGIRASRIPASPAMPTGCAR